MPTLGVVASWVGGRLIGPADSVVDDLADLHTAGPRDISFLSNPRYIEAFKTTAAGAVLVGQEHLEAPCPQIICDDPYLAMATVGQRLHPPPAPDVGIAAGAHVHASARIDPTASIGVGAIIESDAYVGPGAIIMAGCFVGVAAHIGAETLLQPGARVLTRCQVGARVILHAGVVVGSDGFGFAVDRATGKRHKIPQVGIVIIEDDVEVGANSTIDRATFGVTRIGKGTKIDNLVQVAHNVTLGQDCVLVSQTGIAGSAVLGNRVVVGAQGGVIGHLKIADDVMLGTRTGVLANIDKPGIYSGLPAIAHQKWLRMAVTQADIPTIKRRLRSLEERMEDAAPVAKVPN